MAKVLLLAILLINCAISFSNCEDSENEISNAVELTTTNFDDSIKSNNHFIMFFAPWCGHCKRLHPLWEELAEKMNNKEDPKVIIAKVDCTQHQTLCGQHDITGYPTLRFFKVGEEDSVKFKGTRDMPAITEFINQQLNEGEEKPVEEGDTSEDTATPPAKQLVFELTEDNFAQHVSDGNHFVKFYAPWCSHCQRLAPTWEQLGESLKDEPLVSISKIDCTVYRPICQDFEVKGYPTLLWIENGKKIEKYSGSRDFEALEIYVTKMLGNKPAEPPIVEEPEKVETVENKLEPLQLKGDNFAKQIESGVTFIKFYAPWCGHCQQLNPTWEQLAEKMHSYASGVKIAKVDCTEPENKELCVEQQVEGYPTLFAYKNGAKQTEYNGARSLPDLQNYIGNFVGHTEL